MENMGYREIERKVVVTLDKSFYSRLTRVPHVNSYITYHWYTCGPWHDFLEKRDGDQINHTNAVVMKKKTFQGEIARDKTQTYVWGDVKRSKREEITEKHPFFIFFGISTVWIKTHFIFCPFIGIYYASRSLIDRLKVIASIWFAGYRLQSRGAARERSRGSKGQTQKLLTSASVPCRFAAIGMPVFSRLVNLLSTLKVEHAHRLRRSLRCLWS